MARPKNETLHQERREQILKAAAGVFRAKGFHSARTEEICVAAGMSAGTVFRYFRDKEEIIGTIAEKEYESYQKISKALFTREGFLALANIDSTGLEEMWNPAGLGLGLDSWLELYRSDRFAAECKAKDVVMRTQLAASLRAGQVGGWVRPERDADEAALVLLTLLSGIMVEHQLTPEAGFETMAAALRSLVRAYILVEDQRVIA